MYPNHVFLLQTQKPSESGQKKDECEAKVWTAKDLSEMFVQSGFFVFYVSSTALFTFL